MAVLDTDRVDKTDYDRRSVSLGVNRFVTHTYRRCSRTPAMMWAQLSRTADSCHPGGGRSGPLVIESARYIVGDRFAFEPS